MTKITKAVFPVAGLGTRFLPATKATPKEMLAVLDKPLIQYAVEEAVAAGITEIIFVTSANKQAIENHFDANFELEHCLTERDEQEKLAIVQNILPKGVSCIYLRQAQQLGLGHAILCAKPAIGNEAFAVLLADDLIIGAENCTEQLIKHYQHSAGSVIAVQPIAPEDSRKYGVIAANTAANPMHLSAIVEKPEPKAAPSNLGVVGRYVLTPDIFAELETIAKGSGNEYQLTDAIANLIPSSSVYAHEIAGKRFDCGSKVGLVAANVHLALRDPAYKDAILAELKAQL